jgi:hypothetical protein
MRLGVVLSTHVGPGCQLTDIPAGQDWSNTACCRSEWGAPNLRGGGLCDSPGSIGSALGARSRPLLAQDDFQTSWLYFGSAGRHLPGRSLLLRI